MASNDSETQTDFGKWFYRPDEHDDWGIIRDQNRFIIGQIRDPENTSAESLIAHRAMRKDPWEKYARLVSAAPQLLEALEKLLPALEKLDSAKSPVDAEDLVDARHAIKIARGKESNIDDYPFEDS